MLNYKLDAAMTKSDLKEAMMIEQRRRFEEDRKKRIFNARERVIGVDREALLQQIAEKNKQAQELMEKERKFLAEQERVREIALAKEREMQMEKRRIFNEINDFRTKFQKPEDRREYDLYDPYGKKKDLPARTSDIDPRLTISSAQRFEGEDLSSAERKKAQIEQQKAWLEQQMKERKEAEEARKKAEQHQQEALMAREQRTLELAQIEKQGKLKMLAAVKKFNKELASEQENLRKIKHQQEQEDNLAEQLNHVTSDILTEAPDAEKSNFGPHRIVPYTYRRMSPEQIAELKSGQSQQLQERQQTRSAVASVERQWEDLSENVSRTMSLIERDEIRKRRHELMRVRHENQELAGEQNRTRNHIEKIIYTNEPTEKYYQMFNTTSR